MKLSTAASAGALALACWTFPALAQVPSHVAPPTRAPVSGAFPGFLDPSTKIFTPLGRGATTPGQMATAETVHGTFTVIPVYVFDPDLTPGDTIVCTVTLEFTSPFETVGGQIVNAIIGRAAGSFDFGVAKSISEVPIPYEYTPLTPSDSLFIHFECEDVGDSGWSHTFTIDVGALPLPNGDVTRVVQETF